VNIGDFYNLHDGQTCLLVGVGGNLKLTPPEWFDYPSFGVNTIYKYEGWKPTYFVGVDERLEREDGAAIAEKYSDIPKFIPYPDRDSWKGNNFYRFHHRAGDLVIGGQSPYQPNGLIKPGITYYKIMGAVMQIAWYMGFTTMLMIGIQHKPNQGQSEDREHFWGTDIKAPPDQPFHFWFDEYKTFVRAMGSRVKVLNISADTYVPEDVLPRDDWKKWSKS